MSCFAFSKTERNIFSFQIFLLQFSNKCVNYEESVVEVRWQMLIHHTETFYLLSTWSEELSSYPVLTPLGRSRAGSSEILMASFMAASKPWPPSPLSAGPKHSGRLIRSFTTTLAFSSTLSPWIHKYKAIQTGLSSSESGRYFTLMQQKLISAPGCLLTADDLNGQLAVFALVLMKVPNLLTWNLKITLNRHIKHVIPLWLIKIINMLRNGVGLRRCVLQYV